jgi:hypothetical protein
VLLAAERRLAANEATWPWSCCTGLDDGPTYRLWLFLDKMAQFSPFRVFEKLKQTNQGGFCCIECIERVKRRFIDVIDSRPFWKVLGELQLRKSQLFLTLLHFIPILAHHLLIVAPSIVSSHANSNFFPLHYAFRFRTRQYFHLPNFCTSILEPWPTHSSIP